MKYLGFVFLRNVFTGLSKLNAFFASKIHSWLTFKMLQLSLDTRDILLCKEASYCMRQVVAWQKKAKNCVIAHHEYEKAMKPKKKEEKAE